MTDRPYLLFDNSVQWFAALSRVLVEPQDSSHNTTVHRDVPLSLCETPFIRNLTNREATHEHLMVHGQGWTAYALSEAEFGRIMRILDLQPAVTEHAKLIALS